MLSKYLKVARAWINEEEGDLGEDFTLTTSDEGHLTQTRGQSTRCWIVDADGDFCAGPPQEYKLTVREGGRWSLELLYNMRSLGTCGFGPDLASLAEALDELVAGLKRTTRERP